MKTIIWGNLGLLLGALYALGVGFLELRRIAINGGAIVSFDNEVTRLVLPTHGAPQLIGIAAASLLAIIAASAVFHILPLSAAIAYGAGFIVTVVALVIVGLSRATAQFATQWWSDGFTPGPLGWIEKSGLSPAVHLTVLVIAAAPVAIPMMKRAADIGLKAEAARIAADCEQKAEAEAAEAAQKDPFDAAWDAAN